MHRGCELVYLVQDLIALALAIFERQGGIAIAEMIQHVVGKRLRHLGEMVLRMMIEQLGVRPVGGRVCSGAVWRPGIQDEVRKQDLAALCDRDFLYILVGRVAIRVKVEFFTLSGSGL